MDVQTKKGVFKPSGPISVLSFLEIFRTGCDNGGIHKTAVVCLFPYFIRERSTVVLSHGVTADKKNRVQDSKLTT